jgi:hypothetical protein
MKNEEGKMKREDEGFPFFTFFVERLRRLIPETEDVVMDDEAFERLFESDDEEQEEKK